MNTHAQARAGVSRRQDAGCDVSDVRPMSARRYDEIVPRAGFFLQWRFVTARRHVSLTADGSGARAKQTQQRKWEPSPLLVQGCELLVQWSRWFCAASLTGVDRSGGGDCFVRLLGFFFVVLFCVFFHRVSRKFRRRASRWRGVLGNLPEVLQCYVSAEQMPLHEGQAATNTSRRVKTAE